ncbi:MAG: ribonuclease H-like domain-containing protein [Anaerolineae bacterium]|nr:ribonuclease H-like domain-containing protein [Anaerolineae bacterium]
MSHRLNRLRSMRGPRHGASISPDAAAPRVRPTAYPPRVGRAIEELLSGELLHTRHGTCFVHRECYPLDHAHGRLSLSALAPHSPVRPALLARDTRLAAVDLHHLAFIDTETTGLAGGTGTYAFLIGVGLFRDDTFEIHQFFMRDYAEEPAQIMALGELLDGLEGIVSFNGKSFDLPLLETRFLMVRQPPRLVGAPHLDLLPVARRLWKYRLESCALSSLELAVLGVQRAQADVPGWVIPSLYAEYARTGDACEMPRIFYHNAQDILSLVTLAARLCDLVAASPPYDDILPGEDLYGLGRLLLDLGDTDRAEAAYTRAASGSRPHVRERAMHDLATLLKRQERRDEAAAWWASLATAHDSVEACEELAKHHEWCTGDLPQAAAWTERALTLARAWSPGSSRREILAALEHRLARLQRKQQNNPRHEPLVG